MPLHVALIQIDIAFGDPDKNFAKVTTKIHEAMAGKPDIIVLPELWSTGYDLSRLDEIADDEGESTKTLISSLAKQYNVNIISGSVAKRSASGITNTMYSFNRNGDVIGEYSKVHLFRLMDEEKYLQSGQQEGMLEIEGTPCAGLICYDIRFPEWIRKHVIAGANILFVSAEWPKPRLSHWRTLLIARAIENQCYVVACNRSGSDPNNEFFGHSIIIDPWGEIVAEAGEEESILFGKIDIDNVADIRKRIPIFEDRRPSLY